MSKLRAEKHFPFGTILDQDDALMAAVLIAITGAVVAALAFVLGRRSAHRTRDRASEERFDLIGRATNDLLWDWDIVADKTWRGDGVRTLFGYRPEEATEPNFWSSRIHPDDRERVLSELTRFLASREQSLRSEYRLLRRDGVYVHVLERGYVVRDASGTAVRMVGTTMDITARKQMEDQLAQAQRVSGLGRIAASIAHEFNNVLMGMQTNLEVLERRAPRSLRTPIDHMLNSVARGKRVTDEILNFTRRTNPTLDRVDVAKFLHMWEHQVRPSLGDEISLELDVAPDLFMTADSAQLAQALTNLALNARDAMPRGGVLTIHARASDDFVQLRVTDTGVGISKEELDHVFEPMFTTKPGGIGLGLAVVQQIVSRHDGFISAESRVGEGTSFDILIPSAQPVASDVSVVVPQRLRRRLLLVEDEVAVAAGLAMLLELEGNEVESVATAGAAVPAIERMSPDVLILDIGLPDMNGIDLYEQIEKRWPRLPVIFSSGHGDESRLLRWRDKSHVRLLLKPYDYAALERVLAEVSTTANQ